MREWKQRQEVETNREGVNLLAAGACAATAVVVFAAELVFLVFCQFAVLSFLGDSFNDED